MDLQERGRRLGHRHLLVAGAVLSAIMLNACATSGYEYVKSPDNQAFFKVPARWTLYDKQQLLIAGGQSLSPAAGQTFSWLVGFDADPHPSIDHLLQLAGVPKYPAIVAQVQNLDPQARDMMSLSGIRNSVYNVDRLVQDNLAEVLGGKDMVLPGGFYGSRLDFAITVGGIGNVSSTNQVMRVTQVGIVDPGVHKLYLFYVRCESHCFRDNGRLLDQIVQSWTVKER